MNDDPLCCLCSHTCSLAPPLRIFEHPRLAKVPICALCFEKENNTVDMDEDDEDST
jgi:hypothetical protein